MHEPDPTEIREDWSFSLFVKSCNVISSLLSADHGLSGLDCAKNTIVSI